MKIMNLLLTNVLLTNILLTNVLLIGSLFVRGKRRWWKWNALDLIRKKIAVGDSVLLVIEACFGFAPVVLGEEIAGCGLPRNLSNSSCMVIHVRGGTGCCCWLQARDCLWDEDLMCECEYKCGCLIIVFDEAAKIIGNVFRNVWNVCLVISA